MKSRVLQSLVERKNYIYSHFDVVFRNFPFSAIFLSGFFLSPCKFATQFTQFQMHEIRALPCKQTWNWKSFYQLSILKWMKEKHIEWVKKDLVHLLACLLVKVLCRRYRTFCWWIRTMFKCHEKTNDELIAHHQTCLHNISIDIYVSVVSLIFFLVWFIQFAYV